MRYSQLWFSLVLLSMSLVTSIVPCSAQLILDGDFDALSVGTAPDNNQSAGAWYVERPNTVNDREHLPTDFTIVETASFSAGESGNSLRVHKAESDRGVTHRIMNLLTEEIRNEAILRFDTFIPTGGGGASIILTGLDKGRSRGNAENRGPQISFLRDGSLTFRTPEEKTPPIIEFDGWLTVEAWADFETQSFDFYYGRRGESLDLLFEDVPFRSNVGLSFFDSVSIQQFFTSETRPALQFIDNVQLRVVPEPSTSAMLLTGILGLVLRSRRRGNREYV